jgi:hypothetical protein
MRRDPPGANILLLTSLFDPEIGANATRMTNLADNLCKSGFPVTVVTAFPYYSHPAKENGLKDTREPDQNRTYQIVRTYTFRTPKKLIGYRLLTFLSFMVSSALYCLRSPKPMDVILTISPPFFSLLTAWLVSKIKRIPFIIDIQDLYPDTAIQLGKLRHPLLIGIWRFLELAIYKQAAAIVVISSGFKENMARRGINPEKIFIIQSWVDTEKFSPDRWPARRSAPSPAAPFLVLFLGTIGYAQGVEHLLKAAALLKNDKQIKVLFVGDGVEKQRMVQECSRMHLDNVEFLPFQDHEKVPAIIMTADVCLVHLVKNQLYEITIPSKTYEYMAMGKPIVMAVNGEAAALVQQHGCGLAVAPEQPEQISQAILRLYGNPELQREMGLKARRASLFYSEKPLVAQYLTVISAVLKHRG